MFDRGSRPPDFNLVMSRKDNTKNNTRIGVGWYNDNGGLNLKLHPGACLNSLEMQGCYLALFSTEHRQAGAGLFEAGNGSNRAPDYYLAFALKSGAGRLRLGAAWRVNDDFISITLSPGVLLQEKDTADNYLNLWQNKQDGKYERPASSQGSPQESSGGAHDDDIPF